jgi:hypothetical protein
MVFDASVRADRFTDGRTAAKEVKWVWMGRAI